MTFHDRLVAETTQARQYLITSPIISACLSGAVDLNSYQAYLTQAYHHVRHTVPLLEAFRSHLTPEQRWLDGHLEEYIEEEDGHDAWIINDLVACGVTRESALSSGANPATQAMVDHAYQLIARGKGMGFWGMVFVLEGTSVALALQAADQIQKSLALPEAAFSYLRSHGTLDLAHTAHFAELMNFIEDDLTQSLIIEEAKHFFKLYAAIFRSLPMPEVHT
jgi:pyrroloquinoline quinone (PQQ) biosynthesis protein C|tara:strand:+ start:2401 stop:3063 length:663 start_codon:yes stop_codon:yes gene_type:complete